MAPASPTPPQTSRRRATARRLLVMADDDASARAALDALEADAPCGAVLAERLRFGPPETWLGWRAGLGRMAVKLWPTGTTLAPLRTVEHPGVAALLGQGANWRVFGWVAGHTLAAALREGSAPPGSFHQIAAALAALHASGQSHGDLTPANVVLGRHGPVLIDWGEDCAGTPGWRPEAPHDAQARDAYGLLRLSEVLSARPAGHIP